MKYSSMPMNVAIGLNCSAGAAKTRADLAEVQVNFATWLKSIFIFNLNHLLVSLTYQEREKYLKF